MADKIQHARDTLANWNTYDPVIPAGMLVVVYDGADVKFKVGNQAGNGAFSTLAYATGVDLSDYFNTTTDTLDDITDGTTYVKSENNFTDTLKSIVSICSNVSILFHLDFYFYGQLASVPLCFILDMSKLL